MIFKRISTVIVGSAAAVALLAGPATAYVMPTPATETTAAAPGWIGKGEVQIAFGINNKVMQQESGAIGDGVSFSWDDEATYDVTCTWTTAEGTKGEKTHNVTVPRKAGVVAKVDSQNRKTGQWTGWFFTISSEKQNVKPVPVLGDTCFGSGNSEGNAQNGTLTAVELVGESSGGLFAKSANYGPALIAAVTL